MEAQITFSNALQGRMHPRFADSYRSYLLIWLGAEYARRGWVQQYHIGALRNISTHAIQSLGPDTGYDAINDQTFAPQLASLLDAQNTSGSLPKTILYTLHPRDNEVLAAIKNCFQAPGVVGKVQFGSAWWFNDQRDGMNRQIEAAAQLGMLSKFVGMLTDSRSLLSYPRHEYFRRILCDKLGQYIESGEYPIQEIELVGKIVQDICYNNVVRYFGR
jgi:glucuronate isomerase